MKSLVVVAHGSRRAASNDEIRQLTAMIRDKSRGQYDYVCAAFLELAEPSIPDGIEECIRSGATEVIVLPYFLSAGRHVAEDIPSEVKIKQDEYPDIPIHISPYIGAAPGLVDLMLESIA